MYAARPWPMPVCMADGSSRTLAAQAVLRPGTTVDGKARVSAVSFSNPASLRLSPTRSVPGSPDSASWAASTGGNFAISRPSRFALLNFVGAAGKLRAVLVVVKANMSQIETLNNYKSQIEIINWL